MKSVGVSGLRQTYAQHRILMLKIRLRHANHKILQLRQGYSDKSQDKFGVFCYECEYIFESVSDLEAHICSCSCARFSESQKVSEKIYQS